MNEKKLLEEAVRNTKRLFGRRILSEGLTDRFSGSEIKKIKELSDKMDDLVAEADVYKHGSDMFKWFERTYTSDEMDVLGDELERVCKRGDLDDREQKQLMKYFDDARKIMKL